MVWVQKLSLPSRRKTTICPLGLRGIERSTGVCHNTVINWVKEASSQIPDENYEIPETAQLDELFAKLHAAKAFVL